MRFRNAWFVPLLAACGGDTGGSSAPPPSEDRPLAPDFEEVYRIGGIEAEGWDAFSEIADLDFDARGHLYIRDEAGSTTRIVAVDGAGGLETEFGRRGEGPGELRQVGHMVARPDGGAVIVDDGHNAYLLFAADGSFERAVRFGDADASGNASAARVRHGREGGVLFLTRGSTATMSDGEASVDAGDRTIYRVSLDDGEEAAAVPFAEGWEPRPERRVTMETEDPTDMFGMLRDALVYYSPALVFDVVPGGGCGVFGFLGVCDQGPGGERPAGRGGPVPASRARYGTASGTHPGAGGGEHRVVRRGAVHRLGRGRRPSRGAP